MLVALLKLIYSCIQVSDVLVLTVHCKLFDFVFQTFSPPPFIPEISTNFTSHIVHIIPISFDLIIVSILHEKMGYASSIHNSTKVL
jgi:hypothetical protein